MNFVRKMVVNNERWQPPMRSSGNPASRVVDVIGSSGAAKAMVVLSGPQHLGGHKVSITTVSLLWLFCLLHCFWLGSIPAWSFDPSKNFVKGYLETCICFLLTVVYMWMDIYLKSHLIYLFFSISTISITTILFPVVI